MEHDSSKLMADKILVIRFSSLGDIILLTPLFREIKKIYPDSTLDFLTSTTFAPLCQNNPNINHILSLDRKGGKKELNRIVQQCRKEGYTLVFDAHQSLRSRVLLIKCFGIFSTFSRKIRRIDKRSLKRNLLLHAKINLLRLFPSQREAFCRMLEGEGNGSPIDLSTELFPGQENKERVDILQVKKGIDFARSVVVGPGASFKGKCWPVENFLELTRLLNQDGFQVILLGTMDEEEPFWIEEKSEGEVINLAGELSFLDSAELLRRCRVAVSNDSAITHFAEAMKTPSVTIFGPTVKEFGFGPFLTESQLVDVELPCRPCSRNGKGGCKIKKQYECLRSISVNRVYRLTREILDL